jgi:hypothetical protein
MDEQAKKVESVITLDKLISGDRDAIYGVGIFAATALKTFGFAAIAPDVLGRMHVLGPEHVHVLSRPRILDHELDELDEEEAINIMIAQEDSEQSIMQYLKRRKQNTP